MDETGEVREATAGVSTQKRGRLRRLPFLLLLFCLVLYFLVLPMFVPVPQVTVEVRGERVGSQPVVHAVVSVTSWTGDYMVESARKPQLHVDGTTESVRLRLSPYRAKPPLGSRYLIAKQTRKFDFVAEPALLDGADAEKLTSGVAELRFRLYAEHDPPVINDIYYEWQRLMRSGGGEPFNLSTRLLHLREPVVF